MSETVDDQPVTLELDRAEALVLFGWLDQLDDPADPDELPQFEQATLGVRWSVECLLEKELHEPFRSDYDEIFQAAVEEVREEWDLTD